MPGLIIIRPARSLLVDFARWGVAQTPKIRTVGVGVFAVPAHLFVPMPERLLVGAVVDGRPYVPVPDGYDDSTAVEVGVVAGDGGPAALVVVGGQDDAEQPGIDAADAGQAGRDGGKDADTGGTVAGPGDGGQHGGQLSCPHCPRTFGKERGLSTHIRQAHQGV